MKCLTCAGFLFLLTLPFGLKASCIDTKIKEELRAMTEQIELLKTLHVADLTRLRDEFEEFKQQLRLESYTENMRGVDRISVQDLRSEVAEVRDRLNTTAQRQQVLHIRNELQQALMVNSELKEASRAQKERTDLLEADVRLLQRSAHQARSAHAELLSTLGRIDKEVKSKSPEKTVTESYNDVMEDAWEKHAHHLRHQKTMSNHVGRLLHQQEIITERQDNLQAQLTDVQARLEHFKEPNWNLLSTKLEIIDLETKILREEVKNNSQKVSDFDKLHASMLELREEVESIENKADNTIPEIRKEISKLDIDYAQLTAQSSYLKEDQENLRQSVKAIAVSVSNAVDRAETDRAALQQLNHTVEHLVTRTAHQHNRLSDHILKSEANRELNLTETVSLPELMGEVKELQPVESEYQDLVKQLPRDCSLVEGPPGVYLIRPARAPVDAWCAAGATLLQRRYNGTVEFNRKFAEYVRGFGEPDAEYWLGLDHMHRLSADNCSSMRIDMTDIYGGRWYAQYDHFSVSDAGSGFVLEVSGFKGNASDAFEYQNHMEFSAKDRDRDISNTHCAGNYEGGWWFSHCQHVNINGKYTLGLTWFDSARNEWIAVASSEMRLYRRPGCA